MNLIEKFENMLVQDVGTFNSIFTTTPIMGYDSNEPVEIGKLGQADTRQVKIGSSTVIMKLAQNKKIISVKKEQDVKLPKSLKKKPNISELYKILRPSEFMIYSAIKEAGEFSGIEELSKYTSLSTKTIFSKLPRLIELGLIEKKMVHCEESAACFNRLIFISSVY